MAQKLYVFHDESGSPGKDPAFLSCALLLTNSQLMKLYDVITLVRKKHYYYEELHFYKMSSLKHKVYGEVLDLALEHIDLSFTVIVVLRERLDMQYFGNQEHLAYNYFTRQAVYNQLRRLKGQVYIYSDAKNRVKRDNFIEYLKDQLNLMSLDYGHSYWVKAVETLDPGSVGPGTQVKQKMLYEALQFSDLLTGVVKHRYDPGTSQRKLDLRDMVLQHRRCYRIGVWEWKPDASKIERVINP